MTHAVHQADSSRTSGRNRRRFLRVRPAQFAVRIQAGALRAVGVPVEDLSLGGALLHAPRPLPPGERVFLELASPGRAGPLRMSGRVVSTRAATGSHPTGCRLGIRFETVEPSTRAGLRAIVERLAPAGASLEGEEAAALPVVTSAPAEPVETFPEPPEPIGARRADQAENLMVQVKGLLMQVGDLYAQLGVRDREISMLKEALQRLHSENVGLRKRVQ